MQFKAIEATITVAGDREDRIMARGTSVVGFNSHRVVWRAGFLRGSDAAKAFGCWHSGSGFLWILSDHDGNVFETFEGYADQLPDSFKQVLDGPWARLHLERVDSMTKWDEQATVGNMSFGWFVMQGGRWAGRQRCLVLYNGGADPEVYRIALDQDVPDPARLSQWEIALQVASAIGDLVAADNAGEGGDNNDEALRTLEALLERLDITPAQREQLSAPRGSPT